MADTPPIACPVTFNDCSQQLPFFPIEIEYDKTPSPHERSNAMPNITSGIFVMRFRQVRSTTSCGMPPPCEIADNLIQMLEAATQPANAKTPAP